MKWERSRVLFERAQRNIPGGVNSPVRAWKGVGGTPLFITHGEGAHVFDADGNRYLDFVASWGPLILGHAHPRVVAAVREAAARGTTFGAPTEGEIELAEEVCARVPCAEKLRLVSSGTEAAMSAVRLARAFTGRTKIVKFDGCYHGHADGMLARAGSGVATLALPDSPGVPAGFAAETVVVPFNDMDAVAAVLRELQGAVAAVIVEPVCGNMGVIAPLQGFLSGLRELTEKAGAVLIFDEVITGFRIAAGGAQERYQVKPDLVCLGKVLGGGLPLAAFGGKGEIMDWLAPAGPVYQAGTLAGNPLAVGAGRATLVELSGETYQKLEKAGAELQRGLEATLARYGIAGTVNRVGSMLTLFFGVGRVRNADEARQADRERFARFFHGMLERGVYWPPSPFEAAFLSVAHGRGEVAAASDAFREWAEHEIKG
ncbi:MAG: glutamate-1-semialdehyde 2,1-aminomutase [Deltaproteobacteria bacterium]|nr:glutamate-1-semialdehyde 2,1-aminomutase [Deltaproteobacteria bacterium]